MRKQNKEQGFTLIELLVVISIISLLAALAIASLQNAQVKSRDARRLSDIRQLRMALELYYGDHKSYPASTWLHSNQASWQNNSNALAVALSPYISPLPVDPVNTDTGYAYNDEVYVYSYYASGFGGTGQWYMLVFELEDESHEYQTKDGVLSCNYPNQPPTANSYHPAGGFHYGNNSNGIITIGGDCQR